MKKLLLKSMLLLCALVVGSMNGWANTETVTPTNTPSSGFTGAAAFTYAAAKLPSGSTNPAFAASNVKLYVYNTLTITPQNGETITGVSISATWNQGGSGTNKAYPESITASTGSLSGDEPGSGNKTITWTGSTTSALVFTINGAKGNLQVTSITVTYSPSSGKPQCATPTFTPAAGLYTSAQSVTISCSTEGATIHYTTDGSTPTSSSTAYSSAINVSATTTIKAIATRNEYDNSSVASATYTILHAGTEADPYTVADARTAIDASTSISDVYATGIVSEIVTFYSTQYSNISFNISVDGETSSTQLQAYRCGGTNAANVHVGDVVKISGTLEKSGSTYRFASGCQLVSIDHSDVPVINTYNTNSLTLEYGDTSGELAYEINHPTGATLTAAITDGDWISDLTVEADKVTFTASVNSANQRTGIITLSYGAIDKVITITQKKYDIATIPFAFDGGKTELEATVGFTHNGLGSDYGSSPKLKFDDTGDYVLLRINEGGTLSFDIKGNSFSDGTFTVQKSTDGSSYTELASYTELGNTATKTFVLNNDVKYIKWVYTTKTNGNVSLGNIIITKVPEPEKPTVSGSTITLTTTTNMAGWRTYNNNTTKKYSLESDTKAYYASATGSSTVTLTEIEGGVPANTVVILHKTGGTSIVLTETDETITAPGASNLLKVSTADQNLGKVYRLGYKTSDGVGFYSYTTTSAPAGIIYVSSITAGARDFLGFDFGDEATGVNEVKTQKVDGDYYNLAGQRVAQPTKGLYIVNGKKVIMK